MHDPLKHDHCWIDDGAVCLQELNDLLRFRGLKINCWYSFAGVRAKTFREKKWGNVLNVIDLVHPGFHALDRSHSPGDVTGDSHSQTMSFSANRLQNVWLD